MNTEEYISNLSTPLREICEQLRNIIRSVSPDIKEDIKWGVPTYSVRSNICSIMAHKKHVNLQIFRGAHLEDANNLIGDGKDMRHIKFVNPKDIVENDVRHYLRQAIAADLDS